MKKSKRPTKVNPALVQQIANSLGSKKIPNMDEVYNMSVAEKIHALNSQIVRDMKVVYDLTGNLEEAKNRVNCNFRTVMAKLNRQHSDYEQIKGAYSVAWGAFNAEQYQTALELMRTVKQIYENKFLNDEEFAMDIEEEIGYLLGDSLPTRKVKVVKGQIKQEIVSSSLKMRTTKKL